jgi:hypothetical protein
MHRPLKSLVAIIPLFIQRRRFVTCSTCIKCHPNHNAAELVLSVESGASRYDTRHSYVIYTCSLINNHSVTKHQNFATNVVA